MTVKKSVGPAKKAPAKKTAKAVKKAPAKKAAPPPAPTGVARMTAAVSSSASKFMRVAQQLAPSVVRTLVPVIVGALLSAATRAGLDITSHRLIIEQGVTVVVTGAYYIVVRLLEMYVSPRLGWLLGLAKAPAYSPEPAPSPDTGEDVVAEVVPEK